MHYPFEIGRAHMAALAAAARAERAEDQAAEERAEAARNRAMVTGPLQREQYEIARAEADRKAGLAEAARKREAEERRARAQDYRDLLLATGQGRWRTVEEILTAARGWPAAYPAAELSAAHRQEEAQGEVAGSQAQAGEERLLARSRALSEAWSRDPRLRRQRELSLRGEIARQGGTLPPRRVQRPIRQELLFADDDDAQPMITRYGLPTLIRWLEPGEAARLAGDF